MNKNTSIAIAAIASIIAAVLVFVVLTYHTPSPSELSNNNWIVSAKVIKPYNPGGPTIEITVVNKYMCCITNLSAILDKKYVFTFKNVNTSFPLYKGQSTSDTEILIGAGFDTGTEYSLIIKGTNQSIEFADSLYIQISND